MSSNYNGTLYTFYSTQWASAPTRVQSVTPEISISLSPNPVTDRLHLNINTSRTTKVDIIVTDMVGKVLQHSLESVKAGNNQLAIDAVALPKGVYFITTTLDNARVVRRFERI